MSCEPTHSTANLQDGLKVFLDAAPDAIVVVDSVGRISRANGLAETMFGYRPGEMVGRAIEALVPERYRGSHLGDRSRYLKEPRTRPMGAGQALLGLRWDGSEFPVEISLSPLETPTGTHVISIVRDLTERVKAEAMFRGFLDSAPDAVVVVDKKGQIAIVNALTEKMFGYTRAELLGKPMEILVPERYRGGHVHQREKYTASPQTRPLGSSGRQFLGLRKDGSEFPVEISLSPLQTEQGLLVSSIIRDITERRETEQRITASLREKEALLKEIHHRVKNNLQVISSLLRLQERMIDDPNIRELFSDSQQRIQSMALVHEKLYGSDDLARIDFTDYAKALADLLFRSFGMTDERVALRMLSPERVFLTVDSAIPCGLIVNELVSNSLKHAFPAGHGGKIDIEIQHEESGMFVLSVADNGIGTNTKALDESETLGLKLVRTLVRQIDGQLSIETGKGVRFTIQFHERQDKV